MQAESVEQEPPKIIRSVGMFVVTLMSVFLVYGFQWTTGNPLTDLDVAWQSAQFAIGLMTILLCHEMGHYWVAKRHGFELSVPYFLPFPFAFGTLGAVIHLRSLPRNRTALLEMGAAGPIAGFLVTMLCIWWDAPNTQNFQTIEMDGDPVLIAEELHRLMTTEPSAIEQLLEWVGLTEPMVDGMLPVMIMEDPWIMQVIQGVVLGEPLSPFAQLGPFAFAGWVGCLITSINLLPIGQLDGGHISNALFPKYAVWISKATMLIMVVLGVLGWKGWIVWVGLLWWMGANIPIYIPSKSSLTLRAKGIALASIVVFLLSIMSKPIYSHSISLDEVKWNPIKQEEK